jgi:hypothetical protein
MSEEKSNVVALRDEYEPISDQELRWYDEIFDGEPMEASIVGAELVKRGLSPNRADRVVEHAGNPNRPTTRLGMVIAAFSHAPTHVLMNFVDRYAPGSSIDEVVAELRRQAAAHDAEADALEAYTRRPADLH